MEAWDYEVERDTFKGIPIVMVFIGISFLLFIPVLFIIDYILGKLKWN